MGKIFTVCSGSGGTGKSTLALALAAGAAKAGKKTVLLDASGVSRSCDLLLGLESMVTLDLTDVLSRQANIESALYPVSRYPGLHFACASLYDHTSINELSGIVLAIHSLFDVVVIDMPTGETGIGRGVLKHGDERIFVTRPDSVSVRACERLMNRVYGDGVEASLVINRAFTERTRRSTQYSTEAVQSILDRIPSGVIPEDSSIPLCEQRAMAAIDCDGPAKTSLRALVKSKLQEI